MKMPLSHDLLSGLVCWPIFLLANQVLFCFQFFIIYFFMHSNPCFLIHCSSFYLQLPVALSIAKDFVGEDANLSKRIRRDVYMYIAVKECYDSLKDVLDILVVGDMERRYHQWSFMFFIFFSKY